MAYRYYPLERMKRLSEAVFLSYGYSAEESAFITDVILAADRAGFVSAWDRYWADQTACGNNR